MKKYIYYSPSQPVFTICQIARNNKIKALHFTRVVSDSLQISKDMAVSMSIEHKISDKSKATSISIKTK